MTENNISSIIKRKQKEKFLPTESWKKWRRKAMPLHSIYLSLTTKTGILNNVANIT